MRAVAIEADPDQLQAEALLDLLPALMPRLYSYARYLLEAEDARDAVGTAIEHLWRNRRKYPNVDGGTLERWAVRVAINKIRDEAKRQRRRPKHMSLGDMDFSVGDGAQTRAELAEVHGAMRRLRRQDAELIALRFGAGQSNVELAELLRTSPGAVAVALHRAIQRLKDVINEERSNE
jgi:RNA polymerase sigma-70 factor (ECF subfamily)